MVSAIRHYLNSSIRRRWINSNHEVIYLLQQLLELSKDAKHSPFTAS